jgi:NAD(P)-dependent dehydrogenase (short-subunit alcohol dehydrogenase family)
MDLKGKVALVTGGGVRVGRAISLGFAQAGANVVVHYNSSAGPAEETVSDAERLGVEALAVRANLSDPETARDVVDAALGRFGGVDIIVHAASPFVKAPLQETTLDMWRGLMGVLVESFLLLTQDLTPGMLERGKGAIISIIDRGSFEPWPDHLAHGVGKAALWALTRSLAVELAPKVHVNAIVPGPVLAPPGYGEGAIRRVAKGTLLDRWGTPQDVVDAALYLAGADYITGEVLFVDGGEKWAHRHPKNRG